MFALPDQKKDNFAAAIVSVNFMFMRNIQMTTIHIEKANGSYQAQSQVLEKFHLFEKAA